MLDKIVTFS